MPALKYQKLLRWAPLLWLAGLGFFATRAAAAPPPLPDPLMSLMISQPPIDVTSPVVPAVGFDPPVVHVGEDSRYRVSFNALEVSIAFPAKPPIPAALQFRPGAHGQILAFSGTNLQPRTSFVFHVRPTQAGAFTVPAFTVHVYDQTVTVPEARLQVEDTPAEGELNRGLALSVPITNLFVGQAVPVTITCPPGASLVSQGAAPLQVTGDGFLIDQTAFRQALQLRSGILMPGNLATPSYQTLLTPIASGKLSAFAQGFFVTRFEGSIVVRDGVPMLNGSYLPYVLLDSEPVELQVRPLPTDGQLPGFTGAVGLFTLDPPELSTNVVRVGDTVTLRVRIRGEGNLGRLVAPRPPRSEQWQVFAAHSAALPPQIIRAEGFTTFEYTLIPLTTDAHRTPSIPFSFFDPDRVAYTDLTIPSLDVRVVPGALPGDLHAMELADAAAPTQEKEPVLSGLAVTPGLAASSLIPPQERSWYPLVQIAPAAAFLALWAWERRRRFLEDHPDIVRRQRARRALARQRRALLRAARAGDAPAFAAAAVGAMRVACAPHYPAEPRALVGADVLAVLPEPERAGESGTVVRRFFSSTDAAQFSTASNGLGDLLARQGELDRLLQKLEARL